MAAQSSELQWERKMHHSCSFSTGLRVGLLKLAFICMVHVQQHLLGSGCDSLSCALLSYTVPRHRAQAAIGRGSHTACATLSSGGDFELSWWDQAHTTQKSFCISSPVVISENPFSQFQLPFRYLEHRNHCQHHSTDSACLNIL